MAEESKQTIEEMFETIEGTIAELEKDDLPLEKAFSCYEEGIKLVKKCEEEIDAVEKKVMVLSGGEVHEFS
ncbi:MAG: exodeoxyribonuclease VII small subunit [Lachnospiraceae bacterium]|nr:exodeoxyribonuclease VII small subunit [Lachnospiraceae bacterium]